MIFGRLAVHEAEGAILGHSLKVGSRRLSKGRVLGAADLDALAEAGYESVVAARLEADDVHEDQAAAAIAEALAGPGLSASAAFTGRCNLIAETRGLLVVERERLDRLNLVDESLTVATLAPFEAVEPRQMAATIKVIPFAVGAEVLGRCLEIARETGPLLGVASFQGRRVGLIQTRVIGTKESVLDKAVGVIDARLAALGSAPAAVRRCGHDETEIAREIDALRAAGCDLLLIAGASAIVDRRDVVPAAVARAGGTIEHFGMPVDPGNLLLLASLDQVPVLGLPGCARSPKLNGFDWVLQRLSAGLPVSGRDVMVMGAGGLLKETGARPLPRAAAVAPETAEVKRAPRVAAVILAAGRSTRMGSVNKLLASLDGRPMVARVADQVLASRAEPVLLVTGHEREQVEQAVAGRRLTVVHNPEYATGLSSSLRRGLAALPETADGFVVCLGDMPGVTAALLDRLIAAFDPVEGRAIVVPTWRGKRGNPVLLARRFIPEIQAISGDSGARALLGEYPELIAEVPVDDDAVLRDIDTPAELAAYESEVGSRKSVVSVDPSAA